MTEHGHKYIFVKQWSEDLQDVLTNLETRTEVGRFFLRIAASAADIYFNSRTKNH
jgi:hypothetical protein